MRAYSDPAMKTPTPSTHLVPVQLERSLFTLPPCLWLDVTANKVIAVVFVVDSATVVSGGVSLVVGVGVGIVDVDGAPFASLIVLVALEDARAYDRELLAVGSVVAPRLLELEIFIVPELVRIFTVYSFVSTAGTSRGFSFPFGEVGSSAYCQLSVYRAGDKCPRRLLSESVSL